MSCNIRACKGSARSSCSIFSGAELIWQYWRTCCSGKGRGSTETPSKLFTNHNALGQLTNHNTFRFSEGGPSSNPELIEPFVPGWGERCCNNVNYVKNNVIFKPLSMRACSSTPPKQNQDFVKEHNRTPLKCIILKRGNNDWLINNYMVSLNNTVKIHNVIQNKQFMYITYYYKCL